MHIYSCSQLRVFSDTFHAMRYAAEVIQIVLVHYRSSYVIFFILRKGLPVRQYAVSSVSAADSSTFDFFRYLNKQAGDFGIKLRTCISHDFFNCSINRQCFSIDAILCHCIVRVNID